MTSDHEPTLLAEDFAPALRGFDPAMLESRQESIYGLRPDLTLAYLGPGWFRFAVANGGSPAIERDWPLGRPILDAVAEPLRGWYAAAYASCLASGERFDHDYECSSPEVFRLLHHAAYPLPEGAGLLVVHSPVVLRPHDPVERPAHRPDDHPYHDPHGLVRQCCHCRRVERQDGSQRWDWVPPWVESVPGGASHVLCPLCMDYYYPPDDGREDPDPPEAP